MLAHNHKSIQIACLYYYGLTINSLEDIIKPCLHIAKDEMGCDSLSIQPIMDNTPELLKANAFTAGDGVMYWYFVNWSLGQQIIEPKDIGTIMM